MPQQEFNCRITIEEMEFLIRTLKHVMDLDERALFRLEGRPPTAVVEYKREQLATRIVETDTVRTMFMDMTGTYIRSTRAQQAMERLDKVA